MRYIVYLMDTENGIVGDNGPLAKKLNKEWSDRKKQFLKPQNIAGCKVVHSADWVGVTKFRPYKKNDYVIQIFGLYNNSLKRIESCIESTSEFIKNNKTNNYNIIIKGNNYIKKIFKMDLEELIKNKL